MPIETLSPCVVLTILDLIRYDETRSPSEQSRDLYTASLLSRRWSQESQQFLFRHVHLKTSRQSLSFLNATGANPALSKSVRRITMTIDECIGTNGIPEWHFIPVLGAAPRLYELDLTFALPSFSSRTMEALGKLTSTRPVALRLKNACHWRHCPFEAPYQLGRAWKDSLQFVNLGGEPFCFSAAPPATVFDGKLKEFQWTGVDGPSEATVNWWLGKKTRESNTVELKAELKTTGASRGDDNDHMPGPTLRFLSFDSPPDPAIFSRTIQSHGASLRSLRLRDMVGVDLDVLRGCRDLEEFSLDRGMDESVLVLLAELARESDSAHDELAMMTCVTKTEHSVAPRSPLTHLEFGLQTSNSTTLVEVAKRLIISDKKLDSLKTITIKHCEGGATRWEPGQSMFTSLEKWRHALGPTGVEVVDGSLPERNLLKITPKVVHLVDSKVFPRIAGSGDYRIMNSRQDIAVY